MAFILDLKKAFKNHSNETNKIPMQSYMKNKFVFFGIKSVKRKHLLKEVTNNQKEELIESIRVIVKKLYQLQEREFHYCSIELMDKFLKNKYHPEDIKIVEQLITTHSHWDTVDFIAKHILGKYLLIHPNKTEKVVNNFSDNDNMWLNRCAILFQLGYREKTNSDILFSECKKHSKSNEFFIQKAIGWALREYAKTHPYAVECFVDNNQLATLSKREALKHFN